MGVNSWESLRCTTVTLRGANGQDLGAMGEVQVRGFIGKIKVHFTEVAARDARRCFLSGSNSEHASKQVTMSREGNRDTLRVV